MTAASFLRAASQTDWLFHVPVPEAEQFDTHSDGYTNRGKLFRVRSVHVWTRSAGRVNIVWGGPNVKQDGSLGKLALSQEVTMEGVRERCPLTYLALVDAAQELIEGMEKDHAESVAIVRSIRLRERD